MQFIDRDPPLKDSDSETLFRRSLAQLSDQLARREAPPATHVDMLPGEPEFASRPTHPAAKVLGVALLGLAVVAGINAFRHEQPRTDASPIAEARAAAPAPPPASTTPTAQAPPARAPSLPEQAARNPLAPPAAPLANESSAAPLDRAGIREVQTRLQTLGMNPGPVDGTIGPLTEAAVRRYERSRGGAPAGTIDSRLLKRLRQDAPIEIAHRR